MTGGNFCTSKAARQVAPFRRVRFSASGIWRKPPGSARWDTIKRLLGAGFRGRARAMELVERKHIINVDDCDNGMIGGFLREHVFFGNVFKMLKHLEYLAFEDAFSIRRFADPSNRRSASQPEVSE